MDNTLLSFFRQDKDLLTDRRPLRLRLGHPTQMLEDVLLPQHVQGNESICGGLEYRILCVALDAYIPLKELVALPVAVDIVTDRGQLRSICGIVTEARAGDSDGGLASYQLVLRDALSIMEKRNNTRVFRNKNEVEIVQLILDEWMQTNPIIGTCFRYEMDDSFRGSDYPTHEFTMQYNESDAGFMRRLLKRRGIAWHFRAATLDWPSHTMILFDNADTLPANAAGVVRYHRDAETEERDSVTSWCAVRTVQPGRVSRFSWNYKNPYETSFMATMTESRSDQGSNGNEISATLDDYLILSPHAGDSYDDLCELGQLAMKRHDLDSKCFQGEGSVRDFCVGEYFELEGQPEIDMHCNREREFVITALQLALSNNFSKEFTDRAERLFSRSRWMQYASDGSGTRIRVGFTAVRRGIPIVPTYDARTDLPNVPMQSAFVVGPENEEVHCDELGRVKIRFRTTRPEDHAHAEGTGAANRQHDSAWVRVASSWAGNGPGNQRQCGVIEIPRVGSEVLIAFLGGDPDKPIIVAQLFNQCAAPPALGNGQLPDNRYLSGIKSREIKEDRANQLRFDDTTGQISVQLASDHDESQLNLGFLTEPRQFGSGDPRGEGAELRSDGHVSLRGGKGLLITGWKKSGGSAMARDEMIRVSDECSALAHALGSLAEKCRALGVDRNAIRELSDAIKEWESGTNTQPKSMALAKACIGISAPSGVSIATPAAITNYAGADIETAAQKHISFAAGQRVCVNAGAGLSLFAQSGGVTAIAQEGDVQVQSQGGSTEISAAKEVVISASEGKVVAVAKEIVLIAEDGSFIKIGGGITLGTKGTITHHGASFPFKGPKNMTATLPKFEHGKAGIAFQGRYYANRGDDSIPAGGTPVELTSTDGTQLKGKSDAAGRTVELESQTMHHATARVFGNKDSEHG